MPANTLCYKIILEKNLDFVMDHVALTKVCTEAEVWQFLWWMNERELESYL